MKESNQSIIELEPFDQLCTTWMLHNAFKEVRANKGAAGVDGITVKTFENNLGKELADLKKELEEWSYKPKPVRRVEIPKQDKGKRLLGIPCVRDRVVQTALKMLLEPTLDPNFSENSYGFRPNKNQKEAVKRAQELVKSGKEHIVDIDLKDFFNKINHDRLIGRLTITIQDKRILRIIGKTLRSGIMENGLTTRTAQGATQGSPLSPLLSNVILDELDKELEHRGLEFCRYADDCNIFMGSRRSAKRAMINISRFIEKKMKLEINKEKSKIAHSKFVKFLGMTIIASTIAISTSSINRAMAKVKELTPRGTHLTLEQSIIRINKWYMGWSAYHSMTEYPSQLFKIEAHIRRRLRSRIVSQQKSARNLRNKLIKRGLTRKQANVAYTNRGKWALSHTWSVEKAYSNKWFVEDMDLKIRSNEQQPHWFKIRKWIKLT